MGYHSPLSPSGFKANTLCHGRHAYSKDMPNKDSVEARKGTTAHELLDGWFKQTIPFDVGDEFIGENGESIDLENINHIKNTYRYVSDFLKDHPNSEFYTEIRVNPGYEWNGKSTSDGTADIIIVDRSTGTLYVFDYKNGMIGVNVLENYQLLLYAIGAYWKFSPSVKIKKVVMGILQPRMFHHDGPYRQWVIDADQLICNWNSRFAMMVEQIMTADPSDRTAGEEQCRWCKATAVCPTASKKALADARATFQPIGVNSVSEIKTNMLKHPEQLTDEQLRAIMESTPFIKGWLKAVTSHVEERFKHQKPLTGFKMVNGRGSRKWNIGSDDILKTTITLKTGLLDDELTVTKTKSPAQMENSVKPLLEQEQWKEIEKLITKSSGKMTVVPLTDHRPGIALDAKEVFHVIEATSTPELDLSFLD